MQSIHSVAILSKIRATPDFNSYCEAAFFPALFSISPGSERLFRDTASRRRMADVLIDLLLATLDRGDLPQRKIANIAMGHAESGVLPIHMKVARQPMMAAVREACPALTLEEVAEVGLAYDSLIVQMNRAALAPVADEEASR